MFRTIFAVEILLQVALATDLNQNGVCSSYACAQAASTFLKNIDPTVDPCDDFHQFACGNFLKNTVIPGDQTSVTTIITIKSIVEQQLKGIIEKTIEEDELKPFQLVKKYYRACMNQRLIEQDGIQTIQEILKDLGGWPVLEGDKWNPETFDWMQSVYKFKKLGFSVDNFFKLEVLNDPKNSSRNYIFLDKADLSLMTQYLAKGFSQKLVNLYYKYMVDTAVFLGSQNEQAASELKESLIFESELAKISQSSEKELNFVTIHELQQKFPTVEWLEYINTLIAPETRVTKDEVVLIHSLKYFTNLEALIEKTPKRVQANYAIWRAVQFSVSYLGDSIRKHELIFRGIANKKNTRWTDCIIDITMGDLSIAAGALYVRQYISEKVKRDVSDIVENIRVEFENILKLVDWMDEETRSNALDKINAMRTYVAYPDELLDDKKLEDFYGDLELDEDNYLVSALNLKLFEKNNYFKRLRRSAKELDWITHGNVVRVDGFFTDRENSINILAALLQGNFYDIGRPRYMNYGALGSVIGHEITHGFDDEGRLYDKNGNLNEWWTNEAEKAFLEKAQCLVDQYGNCTIPELNTRLNGYKLLGENLADNGGIKEAYLAYDKWVERNGEETKLPGLNYTGRQLFWISAANIWCSKIRQEDLMFRLLIDTHAPHRYRVLIPFSNSGHFSKDFSCPLGSPMNPEHKCQLW